MKYIATNYMYALELAEIMASVSQLNIIKYQPTSPYFERDIAVSSLSWLCSNNKAGIVSESVHERWVTVKCGRGACRDLRDRLHSSDGEHGVFSITAVNRMGMKK